MRGPKVPGMFPETYLVSFFYFSYVPPGLFYSVFFGVLTLSTRQTIDLCEIPVCKLNPISQVLLVEYPFLTLSGNWTFRSRNPCSFSSGYENPRSPAKPQQLA